MLSSFDSGFLARAPIDDGTMYHMTGSLLEDDPIPWTEMAQAFCHTLEAYLCLIVLDDGEKSRVLAEILRKHYVQIDQVTGSDLLVLTTVAPPPDWYRTKLQAFRNLPTQAARFHEREILALGTEGGRERARYNSHALIQTFFEGTLEAPAICYIQPHSVQQDTEELSALGFHMGGLLSEEAVIGALSHLALLARQSQKFGKDTLEFARTAHSLASPTSLRWRDTAYTALSAFDTALAWTKRLKEFGS